MSPLTVPGTLAIREYRPEDESLVLRLLQDSLGGSPVGTWESTYFRWKHLDNPFGQSFMLVAEIKGRVVGFRAFMRWRFVVAGREIAAVRAVDTATHPEYQRIGIFSQLTRTAVEMLRDEADLIFNTPNEKSLPGYLKMGWGLVGKAPIYVRIRRPVGVLLGLRHLREQQPLLREVPENRAEAVLDVLADEEEVANLLEKSRADGERLATPSNLAYLRWRYGSAPPFGYRALPLVRGGNLRGLAVFRIRSRGPLLEATVSETITPRGDLATARQLLRAVARAAPVDHVTAHLTARSAARRAATLAGFVPVPGGLTLVANVLREGIDPDPFRLRSWALSLGDLEVF
jgi:GNAT superfamily N-acetyltransferase